MFITRSISNFWKRKFTASSNVFPVHSNAEQPAQKQVSQERASLSHGHQLASVARVIEDGMASFGSIRRYQRAAAQQLNAADYALQGLLAELATAMPATAVEPVPQPGRMAVIKPVFTESKPAVAKEDGALAA